MASLLIIVGAIWAILGVANIIGLPWETAEPDSPILTYGLMFNVLAFVLPGLVLAGIGDGLRRRKPASKETPEVRLEKLQALRDQELISEAEYQTQRAEILKAL